MKEAMREAKVKAIKLHRQDLETDEKLWEIYYDFSEDEVVAVCPMVWRTHAVDELDMWVKFNEWFKGNTNKGESNNVIWVRV